MTPRPYALLREGDSARLTKRITAEDVDSYAALSGDDNPLHMDDAYARRQGFAGRVVHGMLLSSYLSRLLGTELPGPGVLWMSQNTRFRAPAYIGDTVEVEVRVTHTSPALRTLALETTITNQRQEKLLTGEARTMTLEQPVTVPWEEMVAIVTGGSRGIGAAIAGALGAKHARVVVNYHSRADAAAEVVSAVEAAGGQAIAVQADVGDPAGAAALVDAAQEAYGRVDVLVNNATPLIERIPLEETSWDSLERYLRAYVQAPYQLAEAVLPGMRERGFGRIVNLLSTAVFGTPPAHMSGYVTAKSALWGLTRSMAVELAPHGITVNGVSPSAVITDQWSGETEARRRALTLRVPAQRLPSPDEVAATVLFLLSQDGAYLTGTNLPVAGGEVM